MGPRPARMCVLRDLLSLLTCAGALAAACNSGSRNLLETKPTKTLDLNFQPPEWRTFTLWSEAPSRVIRYGRLTQRLRSQICVCGHPVSRIFKNREAAGGRELGAPGPCVPAHFCALPVMG